ncbi:MAG: exosortase/archaeosortase family protein [Akkermansiaceae bacterium]|nr:exosortase/archaeosortase family protein [Akkermansiaceae bacterium]
MTPSWRGGLHYDYGWLVPPFGLWFFWRRWDEGRPGASVPSASRPPAALWALVIAGVLLVVPLRVLEFIDPHWRLPLWAHGMVVLAVTHVSLALLHGWKRSRGVLPATLFCLVAVPWPSGLQSVLVQGLTDRVVDAASSLLPLASYPVEVAGNALIVNGELLDVAEGCSGIRSFQASIMAGLCLGEMLRFSPSRRVLIVLGAVALAVAGNAARIFLLARTAHDGGRAAMDAAHDTIGLWMLFGTYAGLALLAWLLARFRPPGKVVVRQV